MKNSGFICRIILCLGLICGSSLDGIGCLKISGTSEPVIAKGHVIGCLKRGHEFFDLSNDARESSSLVVLGKKHLNLIATIVDYLYGETSSPMDAGAFWKTAILSEFPGFTEAARRQYRTKLINHGLMEVDYRALAEEPERHWHSFAEYSIRDEYKDVREKVLKKLILEFLVINRIYFALHKMTLTIGTYYSVERTWLDDMWKYPKFKSDDLAAFEEDFETIILQESPFVDLHDVDNKVKYGLLLLIGLLKNVKSTVSYDCRKWFNGDFNEVIKLVNIHSNLTGICSTGGHKIASVPDSQNIMSIPISEEIRDQINYLDLSLYGFNAAPLAEAFDKFKNLKEVDLYVNDLSFRDALKTLSESKKITVRNLCMKNAYVEQMSRKGISDAENAIAKEYIKNYTISMDYLFSDSAEMVDQYIRLGFSEKLKTLIISIVHLSGMRDSLAKLGCETIVIAIDKCPIKFESAEAAMKTFRSLFAMRNLKHVMIKLYDYESEVFEYYWPIIEQALATVTSDIRVVVDCDYRCSQLSKSDKNDYKSCSFSVYKEVYPSRGKIDFPFKLMPCPAKSRQLEIQESRSSPSRSN